MPWSSTCTGSDWSSILFLLVSSYFEPVRDKYAYLQSLAVDISSIVYYGCSQTQYFIAEQNVLYVYNVYNVFYSGTIKLCFA